MRSHQIGLDIPYAASLDASAPTTSIRNLAYDRASVLLNLAALYSQLAIGEDRSHPDGIKRANAYYQVRKDSLLQYQLLIIDFPPRTLQGP